MEEGARLLVKVNTGQESGAGGGGGTGHMDAEIDMMEIKKEHFLSTVGGPAEQTSCEDDC